MSIRGRLVGIIIKSAVVLAVVALLLTLYFSNKYRETVPEGGYVAPPEKMKPPVRREPN